MKTKRKTRVVMNAIRKPVHLITDRAKRYRANSIENRPPGRKQCGYCGNPRNVGVDHVNGNEDDGTPKNLQWACKSCNAIKGSLLKKAGIGKLTRQFNPAKRGRSSMQEYAAAIKVMRGQYDGDIAKAVATIRATPHSVRSAYTSRTWPIRRQMYGPSGRQSEIPF